MAQVFGIDVLPRRTLVTETRDELSVPSGVSDRWRYLEVNRNIVVIGGSAGSLSPLRGILARLPPDLAACVIVVVHIPAGSSGILNAIAPGCPLPVVMGEDSMKMQDGMVYVAPPDCHLLVLGEQLKLGKGPRENLSRPSIDPLFRSAALTAGSRVIGVILSGMLNDGASGLAAVKECGGIAMVQAPNTAEAADMPIAALEATPVDLSAADHDLATAIIKHVGEQAGPQKIAPPGLRLEVEIAAGSPSTTSVIDQIAHPVAFTCPDCGGVLSEVDGVKPLRFRCQVGHAYTGKTLLSEQEGAVDEAMRVALRIIEERAVLVGRMGREAEAAGRNGMAETYAERAIEYRQQAETLREALLRNLDLKVDSADETDIVGHEV